MTATPLAGAANSLVARSLECGPATQIPYSFNGDMTLFMWNLFLMTAMTFVGAMMVLKQGNRVWSMREVDHIRDPVMIYRLIVLGAAIGLTLRCGAEAMNLWGWSREDPVTAARVLMAKRYLDPIALVFGWGWMGLAILAEPGIEHQLRKPPIPGRYADLFRGNVLPIDMWSRWPTLARAGGIVVLSFGAAVAAVWLR